MNDTQEQSEFEYNLCILINKYSQENNSNTPDFILARYLKQCLISFNEAINAREKRYNKK